MKTLTSITNTIAIQIGTIAKQIDSAYKIIVCPERIFVNDYQPVEDAYIKKIHDTERNEETPEEAPYKRTIFFVIKIGQGEVNMAVSNSSIVIQCLSEENDFTVAREILDEFIKAYNFTYVDGMVQSYFMPEMSSSSEQMYAGFRALMSCRGTIRVPEDGVVFIQDICFKSDSGDMFRFPFTQVSFRHSGDIDPQSFAGYNGATMSLNKQTTQTFSFNGYLWQIDTTGMSGDDLTLANCQNELSTHFIEAMNKMNRKFYVVIRTNITIPSGITPTGASAITPLCDTSGKHYVPLFSGWFILQSSGATQELGDISPWSFTFARAKETEE